VCDGTPIHDAHPVAYLLAPELYTRVGQLHLDVVVSLSHEEPAHGMSMYDGRGQRAIASAGTGVTVLLAVDDDAFRRLLIEQIGSMQGQEERA